MTKRSVRWSKKIRVVPPPWQKARSSGFIVEHAALKAIARISDWGETMACPILLVEDDPDVAALISDILEGADYVVDGPYATLSDGMEALARSMPAAAVLDIRLGREGIDLLADDLDLYDIPYVFCSGGFDHPAVKNHPTAPLVPKLALRRSLISTLQSIVQ